MKNFTLTINPRLTLENGKPKIATQSRSLDLAIFESEKFVPLLALGEEFRKKLVLLFDHVQPINQHSPFVRPNLSNRQTKTMTLADMSSDVIAAFEPHLRGSAFENPTEIPVEFEGSVRQKMLRQYPDHTPFYWTHPETKRRLLGCNAVTAGMLERAARRTQADALLTYWQEDVNGCAATCCGSIKDGVREAIETLRLPLKISVTFVREKLEYTEDILQLTKQERAAVLRTAPLKWQIDTADFFPDESGNCQAEPESGYSMNPKDRVKS